MNGSMWHINGCTSPWSDVASFAWMTVANLFNTTLLLVKRLKSAPIDDLISGSPKESESKEVGLEIWGWY